MSGRIEVRVESLPRALARCEPDYLHGAVHPCDWPGGAYRNDAAFPATRRYDTSGLADDVGEVIRFEVACALGEYDR